MATIYEIQQILKILVQTYEIDQVQPGDTCRVDTTLYGLPDSGGTWSEKLLSSIASINLKIGTNFKRLISY